MLEYRTGKYYYVDGPTSVDMNGNYTFTNGDAKLEEYLNEMSENGWRVTSMNRGEKFGHLATAYWIDFVFERDKDEQTTGS